MAKRHLLELFSEYTNPPEDPPDAATSNTGQPGTMFARVVFQIGALMGKDWFLPPSINLEQAKTHIDNTDGSTHGGHIIQVQDHGANLARTIRRINLAGSGNTVSTSGDVATVSTSSGGAGGTDHALYGAFHTDTNASAAMTNGRVAMRTGSVWDTGLVTDANVDAANKDGTDGTHSLRRLGTSAGMALPGNHASIHTRAHSFSSTADHSDIATGQTVDHGDSIVYSTTAGGWTFAPITTYTSPLLLDGLTPTWLSASSLGIESGGCYIPGVGVRELAEGVTLPLSGLVASSMYYLYAYDNSGVLGIQAPTTDLPVTYRGRARSRTGTPATRCIGSFLTNSSGGICKFNRAGNEVWYEENMNLFTNTQFRVTDGNTTGRAIVATPVSCAGIVPVTSRIAHLQFYSDRVQSCKLAHPEINGGLTSSNFLQELWRDYNGNPLYLSRWFPLDSLRQFNYFWSATPAAGSGLFTSVGGYREELK